MGVARVGMGMKTGGKRCQAKSFRGKALYYLLVHVTKGEKAIGFRGWVGSEWGTQRDRDITIVGREGET